MRRLYDLLVPSKALQWGKLTKPWDLIVTITVDVSGFTNAMSAWWASEETP